MHSSRQQRFRDIVREISAALIDISFEPRLMPSAATTDMRGVRSSASTPSLRSRDGTVPLHARTDNRGNVRVVVRVRAFLPRGKALDALRPVAGLQAQEDAPTHTAMLRRNRTGRWMLD